MPHHLTLTAMADAIRQKRLSPVELTQAHLRQIEKHNPDLNAFVVRLEEQALLRARELEKLPAVGPLHGVPLTIKDSFDVAGLPTYCGSRLRLDHRAARDSTAVERLRAAGAVILGKTNCPEFVPGIVMAASFSSAVPRYGMIPGGGVLSPQVCVAKFVSVPSNPKATSSTGVSLLATPSQV